MKQKEAKQQSFSAGTAKKKIRRGNQKKNKQKKNKKVIAQDPVEWVLRRDS
jgi:hypothetical protein